MNPLNFWGVLHWTSSFYPPPVPMVCIYLHAHDDSVAQMCPTPSKLHPQHQKTSEQHSVTYAISPCLVNWNVLDEYHTPNAFHPCRNIWVAMWVVSTIPGDTSRVKKPDTAFREWHSKKLYCWKHHHLFSFSLCRNIQIACRIPQVCFPMVTLLFSLD